MLGSFEGQKHISVFETTLSIQQNTLSVFNIIIQSSQSTVSLIRYPFDLVEFHQKIRFHYPKSKISFPTLTNPSKKRKKQQEQPIHLKRRSFRDLLPFYHKKSNADKIEKYLIACFQHPIISISSILKDFTSVQRDEDALLTSQHTSTTLMPTIQNSRDKRKAVVLNNHPSPASLLLPPPPLPLPTNAPFISKKDMNQFEKTLCHSLTPLPKPPVTINDINLLRVLGKGCMGKVLLVRSKRNGQLYALKCIKKNWVIQQKELIHTRAERDILVRLRSQPFLVNLHHVFQTPSQLFLVLDYYAGGDIATQLSLSSCFSEDRTRFYAAEIVHGLSILHQNGIVYRDLKPENVLIGRDGHIVLTDFGLSKIFTEADTDEDTGAPSTQTFCGTAEYLAPEILLGEKYTFVVDFWSLGTLLFEMLAGTTPFWADTHMEMYKRVLEDNLEFPSRFDPITCHFLTGLLEKEACERLGWGEDGIEEIKLHPYFNSIDWNLVSQRKLISPYIPTIKNETDLSNFDDIFTKMPARISQSSSIALAKGEQDPFENFSFDPCEDVVVASTSSPFNTTPTRTSPVPRMRKRHSAATETAEASCSPSASAIASGGDTRAIKKRQIHQQNNLVQSTTLGSLIHATDRISSIYSRSSLTFSFGAAPGGRDSELSMVEFYERPSRPIPGQSRPVAHSNASTLANSMCSYLSDETNNVVQPQTQ